MKPDEFKIGFAEALKAFIFMCFLGVVMGMNFLAGVILLMLFYQDIIDWVSRWYKWLSK